MLHVYEVTFRVRKKKLHFYIYFGNFSSLDLFHVMQTNKEEKDRHNFLQKKDRQCIKKKKTLEINIKDQH